MHPQSLNKKDNRSFTQKHTFIILFFLCVFVIVSVFLLAYAINDHSIFTSLGGV
ncbi:hypothetical protein SDC9_30488 [bioreactor metagenome]|uniref:Uncharacterized protein n=1 Tax=bioreactor metagenome TaxID=1076179 RepID=A0A644V0U8_9ZZZZ|nr:hypothetical protein [Methanobrevibacter sp.]MEA4957577.1 hypothetical protein [Methanobrevibacter sp.]